MPRNEILLKITGDERDVLRAFKSTERGAQKMRLSLGQVAKGALGFTAVSAAARSVADVLPTIVGSASDINEQMNKVDVVFGRSAAQVKAWSETTAAALGLSQRAALQAAGGFGQILEAAGLTEERAAGMSRSLVRLAADIASFNNLDPTVALDKLRSGLAGESEPLRQVGVLLSEARVKAEAYSAGIARAGAKLSEAQKVQARYALILKDTATAQGDFSRTSDGLANQQRILAAQVDNLRAKLGEALLPTVLQTARGLNKFLGDTDNQRLVQEKLTSAVRLGADAFRQIRSAIEAVAGPAVQAVRAVGGLRNAIEALLVIATVGKLVKIASSLTGIGVAATAADGRVKALRVSLLRLGAIGAISIAVDVLLNKDEIDAKIRRFLQDNRLGFLDNRLEIPVDADVQGLQVFLRQLVKIRGANDFVVKGLAKYVDQLRRIQSEGAKAADQVERIREAVKQSQATPTPGQSFDFGAGPGFSGTGGTVAAAKRTQEQIERANRIFDSAISRALGRADLEGDLRDQVTVLERAASLIEQRIAKTKDVTRRLNLEDRVLQIRAAAAQARQQIGERFLDALSLRLDRARTTATFKDDLAVLRDIEKGLLAQLNVTDSVVDVQRRLLDVRQQIQEAQRGQRDAAQFRALGFDATGGEVVPGADKLRAQLRRVTGQVQGGFLDNSSTRKMLERIRKVLSGGLGSLSREVRAKIKEMLDGIDDQLRESGNKPLTRTRKLNANRILEGLGLSPEEERRLRARLSGFNSAGRALAAGPGTVGAFGVAAVAGGGTIVVDTTVQLDGQKVGRSVTRHQQKRGRRNPPQTRGRNV